MMNNVNIQNTTSNYAWRACLYTLGTAALFVFAYVLWRSYAIYLKELQKREHRLRQAQLLDHQPPPDHRKQLLDAFKNGLARYKNFDKSFLAPPELGIPNGLLTWFRHGDATPYETFYNSLSKIENLAVLKKQIIDFIVEQGSLWSNQRGNNHSITNFFLDELKKSNHTLYCEIVEKGYHVILIKTGITLYRRDTRPMRVIFEEGFRTKDNPRNKPEVRRANFATTITEDFGVSTAKVVPPKEFGCGGYFIIEIPSGHTLELIDICASPRNKNSLTTFRINLQEVNSISAIPREYIVGFQNTRSGVFYSNPNYVRPAPTGLFRNPLRPG